MINTKKILSLLICVVLLLCVLPTDASAASDFPTVLAEAKKGVVQVYGLGDGGRVISSWFGTGFAVGKAGEDSDTFLTNWHVVTSSGEYSLDKVRIWILLENCEIDDDTLEPDPNKSITCEVLKTTTGNPDYAIIRATEPIQGYKPLALLSSEAVPDGTKVYALGYPGVVGEASASHYGIDDITSTDGIISRHMQYAQENNTLVLMHTAQISGGNSGGPLITEDGAVVGLNTYGFGENAVNMNRYCAVYINYAIDGLDELGLPYELYGSQESDPTDAGETTESTVPETGGGNNSDDKKEDFNWIPIVIIAGGAVVAVATVVWIIVLKKKKEREEELRRRQEEARRHQEAEHRQQEEARHHQEALRRRREQDVKAQIQLNNGTVYPVRASGCMIGRQNDCSIVLPESTQGVSRHHCKLEFQGDQLILTDLNSSYGTYIHGKRIPANTPVRLSPGSSFCLGSEKCKFTVR